MRKLTYTALAAITILGLASALISRNHPTNSARQTALAPKHTVATAATPMVAASSAPVTHELAICPLEPQVSRTQAVPTHGLNRSDLAQVRQDTLQNVFPGLNFLIAWGSFNPDSLTVCVLPGMALPFKRDQFEQGSQRNTWTGSNGVQGCTLTYCATGDLFDAVVTLPGANQYAIHATNAGTTITELFDDKNTCSSADKVASRDIHVTAANTANSTVANADTIPVTGVVYTVDVLLVYCPEAKTVWGATKAEIMNRYASFLAAGNSALQYSQVTNVKLNLVDAMEAV